MPKIRIWRDDCLLEGNYEGYICREDNTKNGKISSHKVVLALNASDYQSKQYMEDWIRQTGRAICGLEVGPQASRNLTFKDDDGTVREFISYSMLEIKQSMLTIYKTVMEI